MLAFVPALLPGSLKGLLRLLSLVPVLIRSLLVAIIVHCVPPAALGRGLASFPQVLSQRRSHNAVAAEACGLRRL
jgi:hypothetical protein